MSSDRQVLPRNDGNSSGAFAREVLKKRKRMPKASIACDTCRRLKSKCDQNMPCATCMANSEECVYRSKRSIKQTRVDQRISRDRSAAYVQGRKHSDAQEMRQNVVSDLVCDADGFTQAPPVQRRHDDSGQQGVETRKAPGATADLSTHSSPGQEMLSEEEPSPRGFGETNSRTNGKEFYGPGATLAFLWELSSRASAFRRSAAGTYPYPKQSRASLVNMMDGEGDLTVHPSGRSQGVATTENSQSSHTSPSLDDHSQVPFTLFDREVEKQCIELYFSSLHRIYQFLNKANFLKRCAREVWADHERNEHTTKIQAQNEPNFRAVYNAVVALGALTASDSVISDTDEPSAVAFWDRFIGFCEKRNSKPISKSQIPRELAKTYFSRAKALLHDIFESCSLDTQQALFLMSIFCMYALKPHSSYMYHGTALRVAMAIGASNLPDTRKNSFEGIRTWWMMYSHEMELCSLLGRETCLRDAEHYPVFLFKFGEAMPPQMGIIQDETLFFSRCNTELARILKCVSEQIYYTGSITNNGLSQVDRLKSASSLDSRLAKWTENLKPIFDLDVASLTESETVTKRKIILQLRLDHVRIMIHRPFMVLAANNLSELATFEANVKACIGSAQSTIQYLHDTFKYRPFFRTWWYATSYAFNASIIILYSLVTFLYDTKDTPLLLASVEKALEIFQAIDGITVARRCATLIKEMLQLAELAVRGGFNGAASVRTTGSDLEKTAQTETNQLVVPLFDAAANPLDPKNATIAFDTLGPYYDNNTFTENSSNAALFPSVDDDFFRQMMAGNFFDSFGVNTSSGIGFDSNFGMFNDDNNAAMPFHGSFTDV